MVAHGYLMSFSSVMLQIAKAISLLFGLLLLYISFFMYEDEQGKLQNRIENIWIAVNDKQKASADKTTALFNKVADVVRRILNRILGTKFISIQMIGVSSSASFASILAVVGLILLILHHVGYSRHVVIADPLFYPALIIVGLLLLVLSFINLVFASLPSLYPSRITRILSLIPVCFFSIAMLSQGKVRSPGSQSLVLFPALFISIISDVLLLGATRFSIRWISTSDNRFKILLAFLVQMAIVVFLVFVPFKMSATLLTQNPNSVAAKILVSVVGLNGFTALAASAFLFALIIVVLHRAFWPLLDRTIYAVARFTVVRNRALMSSLAVIFVSYGLFISDSLWGKLADWLLKRLSELK
jgi:hypothetical protein